MKRILEWGCPNVRDLGGLTGRLGTTLFGRVARGPRRERLSDQGWAAAKSWGLATVVDLRCSEEVGRGENDPIIAVESLDGIRIISTPTEDHSNQEFRDACFPILDSPQYWAHHLRILPGLVRKALETIAEARSGVLVHCSAGRDRTGLITALLLANAGIPAEIIADDYELSVRTTVGTPTHAPTYDRQADWENAQVEQWIASARPVVVDFAHQTPAKLAQIGISEPTKQRLRHLLLGS